MSNWGDTLRALFYGPGWQCGTPRLGDPSTSLDVQVNRAKYDPPLPLWQEVYVVLQYFLTLLLQQVLIAKFSVSIPMYVIWLILKEVRYHIYN